MSDDSPRAICADCERPKSVCWCRQVVPQTPRTKVVVLQHPREDGMPIGTARMVHRGLVGSELHVAVEWDEKPAYDRLIAEAKGDAFLLFPGPNAGELKDAPRDRGLTMIVVDGTWAQAKKLVRKNPKLAALPRYGFEPPAPSAYRIRREPKAEYVSTVEAVAHALRILEDRDFDALLGPFHAMVDMQIEAQHTRENTHRHLRRVGPPPLPRPVRAYLDHPGDRVCLVGEANAFAYDAEPRPKDEIVHVLAVRLSTGALFEEIVAPTAALSPGTTTHTRLTEAEIRAGIDDEALRARFAAFLRPDDAIVTWGHYARRLLVERGVALPEAFFDARAVVLAEDRKRAGALDAVLARKGLAPAVLRGRGRGGERLAALEAVVRDLARQR